jgi:glycosyltransferase involved in cell wall biosynthesis
MSPIDFTIVTASYNYGHYIGDCLASVAEQYGVTFEHLVMDAGSKDDTAEVVARFPNAKFFQEPDKGMCDGINKGFLRAKGKWVIWLNADDRLKPGALLGVKKFAEANPTADVIYGAWDFVDADGKFERRMGLFPFQRLMLAHLGCYIGSTSCFYRKETVIDEGFLLDLEFKICMDGEFYNRLAARGKSFAYLPRVLAEFRRHGENLSLKNFSETGIRKTLLVQRQYAEARSIRRFYGITLFSDDYFNEMLDGILYVYLRIQKVVLKKIWSHRLLEP